MPRFVVLEHDHPEVHWDFLLEWGDTLRTWRLAAPPLAQEQPIVATLLPAHRRMYLDYEGPVSGGRGTVVRWDSGDYECQREAGELVLVLRGRRLQGRAVLQAGPAGGWLFSFTPSGAAE